jgi:hypothetical protein
MFNGLCIGILISILVFLLFERLSSNQENQTINQLKIQVDSLSHLSRQKEIEYRDRVVTNSKIVTKWNHSRDTLINIDTLYFQAQTDINYLDTSLKKCDTALSTCMRLTEVQKELIKNTPKCSKFGLFTGLGLGVNQMGQVAPTLNISLGFKIK